ncbi:MAG: sigma-70 family RNA polymerase sigma factor [Tannerella sp.]|jgi:RNA polymerase sigma-70 factor (ECF subfamily)|nr:sigma-70 family RNA polymerase sigma factor [Tannerella sp.]
MEAIADTFYVRKIQAGEEQYFTPLLKRYSRQVFSLIVKMTENREDAEELTQDVFLKVYRSLDSFHGNSSFSTWLYRIAYNTAISALRRQKHERLSIEEGLADDSLAEEDAMDTLEQTSREEQMERLEQALEQLPPDERALILLFYRQEKRVDEIAIITGLTVSNVKTKLHRIRKKMLALMLKIKKED